MGGAWVRSTIFGLQIRSWDESTALCMSITGELSLSSKTVSEVELRSGQNMCSLSLACETRICG